MNPQSLTDFVLNELEGGARREVEAAIERDPAVRAEVEEIRSVVTEIEAAMRDEVAVPAAQAVAKTLPAKKRWYHIGIAEGITIAVCCGLLLSLLMPAQHSARHIAREMAQRALHSSDTLAEPRPLAPIDADEVSRYAAPEQLSEAAPASTTDVAEKKIVAADNSVAETRLSILTSAVAPSEPESLAKRSETVTVAVPDAGTVVLGGLARLSESPAAPAAPAASAPAPASLAAGRAMALGDGAMRGVAAGPGARGGMAGGMYGVDAMSAAAPLSSESLHQLAVPLERSLERLDRREDREDSGVTTRYRYLRESDESKSESAPRDPYNSANDEAYQKFAENEFLKPSAAPFSTFSIDVDTAAYSTMRRFVRDGSRPPKDAVRLEEYINYFKYSYPQPKGDAPFAVVADVARCPWESQHLLARVALQGKIIDDDARPAVNLVFLIDVSGSMSASNRLPLVKRSLTELVERLQSRDRVAIVTYAGSTQVVLPSVSGNEKRAILDSIESLTSGGSTAGASGIKLAYETARKYYTRDGQNRVILCTDGDFNVGTTDNKTLEEMIGDEAKSGVFLTILGFGMGNYKDERLSVLSQRGNGNYGYIDSLDEAQKLLVEGLTGTLVTIAKDVKIQIDFNPKRVAAYRLLGYENRKLRDEYFHNDAKDAGEIGAGHSVTALYEIVPVGVRVPQSVDASRYAEKPAAEATKEATPNDAAHSEELLLVKLRYKEPEASKSKLIETPLVFAADEVKEPTGDFAFASGVALFGMLLRDSKYAGSGNFSTVRELVSPNTSGDKYRQEFLDLVKRVAGGE